MSVGLGLEGSAAEEPGGEELRSIAPPEVSAPSKDRFPRASLEELLLRTAGCIAAGRILAGGLAERLHRLGHQDWARAKQQNCCRANPKWRHTIIETEKCVILDLATPRSEKARVTCLSILLWECHPPLNDECLRIGLR